jgi:hypothetical protein
MKLWRVWERIGRALHAAIDKLSLRGRILVLCWASIGVACAVAGALSILSQGAEVDQRQLRDLGRAHDTASTLEKDFTSLTRDMYRMVASPTPAHIAAARGNLDDFRAVFESSSALLSLPRYRAVQQTVSEGIAEFEALFAAFASAPSATRLTRRSKSCATARRPISRRCLRASTESVIRASLPPSPRCWRRRC